MATSSCDTVTRLVMLLKSVESDNERLSALLIVAEVLKSHDLDQPMRRKLFDAVGFDFINRLILAKSDDSKEVKLFHEVGVAILSSYCNDDELVLHPQVTSKIPRFNEFISSNSTTGLVSDSLHCLESLVVSEKGREYLWYHKSLLFLVDCYITHHQSFGSMSKSIALHLISKTSQYNDPIKSTILQSLQLIGEKFKTLQSEVKFELCQLLTDILNICGEYITETNWLINVGIGLRDVLQSRLDTKYRNMIYTLLSVLCMLYGCQWLADVPLKEKNTSLLLLVAHLMSVEISLLLEDSASDTFLILSCFSIVENVIIFMSKYSQEMEEQGLTELQSVTEEHLVQLHTVVLETVINISRYVHRLSGTNTSQNQLLLPAVRVLGAWLAEDSLSLTGEIKSLLPFLLRQCSKEIDGEEFAKFLLPGLSHLVNEEEYCQLLLASGLLEVLLNYITSLSSRAVGDVTIQSQLTISLSLTLTICTNSTELTDTKWLELLPTLTNLSHTVQGNNNMSLKLHCVTLYLMIARRLDKKGHKLLNMECTTIVDILEVLVNCLCISDASSEITELCHLGFKELAEIIRGWIDIKQILASHNLTLKLLQTLTKLSEDKQKSLDYSDVISSASELLSTFET